jgi:hypothetical protein
MGVPFARSRLNVDYRAETAIHAGRPVKITGPPAKKAASRWNVPAADLTPQPCFDLMGACLVQEFPLTCLHA